MNVQIVRKKEVEKEEEKERVTLFYNLKVSYLLHVLFFLFIFTF